MGRSKDRPFLSPSRPSTSPGTRSATTPRASSGAATSRSTPALAYTPFVRLALACFQPHSVNGAHLSRVVLADFVQLMNGRTSSLTRPKKESDTFSIAVSGLSYSQLTDVAGSSIVELSIEARRANTEPDKQAELAWQQVLGSTKTLTLSAGPAGTTMWTGQTTLPNKSMGEVTASAWLSRSSRRSARIAAWFTPTR